MIRYLYISLLLSLTACTSAPQISTAELKKQELQKRYDNLLRMEKEHCLNNAILEAEIYIDSIIYQLTQFSILDSISMIEKPNRPPRPDYLPITDPGPIKPFDSKK